MGGSVGTSVGDAVGGGTVGGRVGETVGEAEAAGVRVGAALAGAGVVMPRLGPADLEGSGVPVEMATQPTRSDTSAADVPSRLNNVEPLPKFVDRRDATAPCAPVDQGSAVAAVTRSNRFS